MGGNSGGQALGFELGRGRFGLEGALQAWIRAFELGNWGRGRPFSLDRPGIERNEGAVHRRGTTAGRRAALSVRPATVVGVLSPFPDGAETGTVGRCSQKCSPQRCLAWTHLISKWRSTPPAGRR